MYPHMQNREGGERGRGREREGERGRGERERKREGRERERGEREEEREGSHCVDLNPSYTGKGSIADAAEKRGYEHHH